MRAGKYLKLRFSVKKQNHAPFLRPKGTMENLSYSNISESTI